MPRIKFKPQNQVSRLALKIVVGAREQGTLNWEQEESFGRFYFSSHTFKFFSSPTYSISQSSNCSCGMRENSLVLWVTKIKLFAKAIAAICKS